MSKYKCPYCKDKFEDYDEYSKHVDGHLIRSEDDESQV